MDYYLRFDVDPVAKGRPRMTRSGRVFTPAKTRSAEAVIKAEAMTIIKTPLQGPVSVHLSVQFKRPKSNKTPHHVQRPDLDNVCKLVMDALNGVAYVDDCQIISLKMTKSWSKSEAKIEVWIGQAAV